MGQWMDKRFVQLDRGKGKNGQITQAGITGAEIIQTEADAQCTDLLHAAGQLFHGSSRHAFGQFQLQTLRPHTGMVQNLLQHAKKLRSIQLKR